MGIKGMSAEITDALNFDPFDALSNEGAGGTGPADSGTRGEAPLVQQRQDRQDRTAQPARQPPQVPGEPQRDPSGRFVPRSQQPPSAARASAAPAAPASRAAPASPTPPAPAPGQQPAEPVNAVAELMSRLKDTPLAFQSAAPADAGVPGTYQAPVPGAPGRSQAAPAQPQTRFSHDYSRPWNEQKVDLPPQLLDAIFNEDRGVAAQGMAVLVNSMYNSIMNDVHTRVAEVLRNAPHMTASVASVTTGQQALKAKMYGAFPELGDQQGMQTTYALATQVANMYSQMGQTIDPMSDDFINYVGEQAMKVLGRVRKAKEEPRRQFSTDGAGREQFGGNNPFMEAIGMA